ncbi:hypothetical protein GCM10022207_63310 [Streptomyces lannensis]|uniref:RCK C-terminal domain-containing protein n=1 Tax=Streptomyces lannensis TaxID=766498 RepID=A0ABP7KT47_9ACTN
MSLSGLADLLVLHPVAVSADQLEVRDHLVPLGQEAFGSDRSSEVLRRGRDGPLLLRSGSRLIVIGPGDIAGAAEAVPGPITVVAAAAAPATAVVRRRVRRDSLELSLLVIYRHRLSRSDWAGPLSE